MTKKSKSKVKKVVKKAPKAVIQAPVVETQTKIESVIPVEVVVPVSELSQINHELLMIKEVAAYLRVTEQSLYRLARAGKIPFYKVGGAIRFKKTDIEAYLSNQTSHGLNGATGEVAV